MSGIATGTALLIGGGVAAGTGLAGAAMQSGAAKSAAQTQAQAADQAAQLQYQTSQNALDFQKQQWQTAQGEMAPWLQSGGGALNQLDYLMGITPNTNLGYQAATSGQTPSYTPPTGSPAGVSLTPNPRTPYQMPFSPNTNAARSVGSINSLTPSLNGGSGVPTANPATGIQGPGSSGLTLNGLPSRPMPEATPSAGPALGIQGGGINNQSFAGGAPAGQSPAGGFGSLLKGYGQSFTAPTAEDMAANDPGYQARWNLGQTALERSAAARGNLLTGGTAQAENQLAQDYASNEYSNYYNQALNKFNTNYNVWSNDQANTYNRLAAMSGQGQTAANQLGYLGANTANGVSNNLLSTAGMMGQQYNNAAAANASGMVGSANAWGGALSNTGNSISNLMLLNQLYGGGGAVALSNLQSNQAWGNPGIYQSAALNNPYIG